MRLKENKAQLQIPFAWLFAILVGISILFLAFFVTTKIFQTEQVASDAETAKEIGILLNPLETGFETGKTTSMILPTETRIFNRCDNEGYFGRQIIKLSQKSFNKWSDTNIDISFENKHIFSENFTEGKRFFIFSKPFEFPFKIADVIYITSSEKNYCFITPLDNIREEISNLNQGNLFLESEENCPENSIEVCFGGDCEISVNSGYVEKNDERMYFAGDALMYAAIFSDRAVYECQVKRLMQRGSQLTQIYIDKANFISGEQCNSAIGGDLLSLKNKMDSFEDSMDIDSQMVALSDSIQTKNGLSQCSLW